MPRRLFDFGKTYLRMAWPENITSAAKNCELTLKRHPRSRCAPEAATRTQSHCAADTTHVQRPSEDNKPRHQQITASDRLRAEQSYCALDFKLFRSPNYRYCVCDQKSLRAIKMPRWLRMRPTRTPISPRSQTSVVPVYSATRTCTAHCAEILGRYPECQSDRGK